MPKMCQCRSLERVRYIQAACAAALAAVAVMGVTEQASAQTLIDWVGAPSTPLDFTDPINWNPSANAPTIAGDYIATINNMGIARIDTATAESSVLLLGVQPGQEGHVVVNTGGVLNVGTLRVGGIEAIPDPANPTTPIPNGGGIGSFVQNDGTVNVTTVSPSGIQSLYVGDAGLTSGNTANGSYTIEAGTLVAGIADNDAIVIGTGAGTLGAFVHEGGAVTSSGFVSVGRRGAAGTYTMSGGTLNVGSGTVSTGQNLFIGDGDSAAIASSSGTFTQSAGGVVVNNNVEIGRRSGTGAYTISGGTLDAVGLIAGGGPSGEISAVRMRGDGTFNVRGSATVKLTGNLNIGFTSANITGGDSSGAVNIEGGLLELSGNGAVLAVGNGFGGTGTLHVSGGSLTMAKAAGTTSLMEIGRHGGTTTSASTSASGTLRVSGTGLVDVRQIALNSTGGGNGNVGTGTIRSLVVEGGTLRANTVTFGTLGSRSNRSLQISGGDVQIGFLLTGNPDLANGGSAVTHISGGAVDIDTLEIFSNSRLKLSTTMALDSTTTFGNATVEVTSGNTLTFNGPSFGTGVTRVMTKIGPGALTIAAPQSYAVNSGINVNEGTLNLNTSAPGNLTINVNSTTAPGRANFNAAQRLIALNVGAGTTAAVAPGGEKTLHVSTLAISATLGKLQLADNDLLVEYGGGASPEAQIRQWVRDGRSAGSTSGIFVTPGPTSDDRVLAVADNAQWLKTSFNGIPIVTNTVVGKYTYFGDSNLDGAVTGDDYLAVDSNLGTGTSWIDGDFNMDNAVTGDDYLAIDTNLGKGTPNPLAFAELKAEMVAMHAAMFGEEYLAKLAEVEANSFTTVPEPGAAGLTLLGALGVLRRRCRRGRQARLCPGHLFQRGVT